MLDIFTKLLSSMIPERSTAEPLPDYGPALRHAQESYANINSIIRTTDIKTSILLGFILIVTGFAILLPFALLILEAFCPGLVISIASDRLKTGILGLAWIGAVACGYLAFINALLSLMARTPNTRDAFAKEKITDRLSVLFCVYPPEESNRARECLSILNSSFTAEQALEEYRRQVLVVGAILGNKIHLHRKAIFCLGLEGAALLLALLQFASSVVTFLL